MASRRMISTSLGDSEKFSRLKNDTHRLAYVLLVTWADAEGRYLADAVSLRGKLYTRLPWTANQVEAALLDMHDVGLIRLYTCGRHRYGVIVGFHEHNTIRRNPDGSPKEEAPSRYPAPPEEHRSSTGPGENGRQGHDTGVVPEPVRSRSGTTQAEVEVEVEVETEQEQDQDLQPSSTSLTRTHPHDAFAEAWNQHRGHLPATRSLDAKRKRAIDTLRKEHPADALDLFRDATQCVAADEFWVQRQYGIDNLLRPGRVLEKAEKWRAGVTQLGEANIRMATQVDRWARALDQADERPVN